MDLKPCPFCGGQPVLFFEVIDASMAFWICCAECFSRGPMLSKEEDCIEAWNERYETAKEQT